MAKPGTFHPLWVWLDGDEVYADARLAEDFGPEHVAALSHVGAGRRKGFGLLVRRNWQTEWQTRRLRLPRELDRLGLSQLPDGQAVNRLIGYDDGDRWVPGVAGLEPVESRVLRRSVIDRWATWEIASELKLAPSSVRAKRSDARRKLRTFLGLDRSEHGSVRTQAVLCPSGTLTPPAEAV